MNGRLLLEALRVAVSSLRTHGLRTFLTTLGMAIGIFAITIIFTLVNSLNFNLNKNLSALGNRVMYVHHFPWTFSSMQNWQKYIDRPHVDYKEYLDLKKSIRYADALAFEARLGTQTVKRRNIAIEGVLTFAVTESYIDINSWEFGEGRPFTELEVNAARQVCVIGANVSEGLFPDRPPLGESVTLKGKKLKVVGVMKKQGGGMFGVSVDDAIFIPYPIAPRMFKMDSRRLNKVILARAVSEELVPQLENELIGQMRRARGLRPSVENNFEINKPEMLMNLVATITMYLQYGGTFISIFAILVGGFGIGNIMFTTVKERTFEIGLQKALGATKVVILFQFLAESVILCLIGGAIGLLLQFALVWVLSLLLANMGLDFQLVFSWGSMLFGVGLSAFIGLLAGFIPSWIASRLDPVESMRQ